MEPVSRFVKMNAKPCRGADLAEILLKAARDLAADPGCLLYLVNRQKDDPDTVWVTELWRSQADLDATLAQVRESSEVGAAMEIVASSQLVDLELLGGKGPEPR